MRLEMNIVFGAMFRFQTDLFPPSSIWRMA